jgi:hypothetical protein
MKKTSSKIIIGLILAIFLWTGVSFDIRLHAEVDTSSINNSTYAIGSGFWSEFGRGLVNGEAWWNLGKSTVDIGSGIATMPTFLTIAAILTPILGLMSALLAIVAALLDGAIQLSIGGFRGFIDSSSITTSWAMIRDMINISFIFVLLYIAIATIIGNAGIKTKVLIKDVIVAAILINFSLFFTRIIIDGGNILATVLYNKLSATSYGTGIWGLTGPIMNSLKLQTLLNFDILKLTGQSNAIFALVFSVIIIGATIWAFLYAAILFLIRNVMLLFLLAISPLGFIGGTLPWFKEKSSEWWSALIGQVAVAPYFLFMMFLLVKMIDGIEASNKLMSGNFMTGAQSYFSGKSALNYTMFIQAFLVLGMLLIAIKTTKKLAGKTGDITQKILNAGLAAGVAAFTGGAAGLAARGASMATRGRALMASGAASQLRGGGAAAARATRAGLSAVRTGQRLQTAGNLLSGQTFTNAAAQPNMLGTALTAAKKNLFDTAKSETGADLDAAFKYREKMDKEYEKRYGDIANKIGGKKEREELDILKNISTNIKSQAETRSKRNHNADWDRVENMPKSTPAERAAQKSALDTLKATMKTEVDSILAPAVAREMGVDLTTHNARQDELKVTIENKTVDKNQYAAKIPNKKIADKIRSQATYEAKDKPEQTMEKLLKDLGFEKAKPTTPTPPKP